MQSRPRRRTCGIPLHASNSATASPQNQLHLAECTCKKKLHGGLRCATRGWRLKYKSRTQSVDFRLFLLIAPLSTFLKKIRNSTSRKEIILALFTVVPKVSPVYNKGRGAKRRRVAEPHLLYFLFFDNWY